VRWTGGQYSLVRAALAIVVAVKLPGIVPSPLLAAIGAVACAPLLLGLDDRVAALIVLGVLGWTGTPAALVLALPLLLHLATPPAPYGSVAARGRADPGGGWQMPPAVTWAARLALLAMAAASPWLLAGGVAPVLLLALYAIEPGRLPGRGADGEETMYYDGTCGLCHRAVRFVLAEGEQLADLRFATLQGASFEREVPDSIVVRAGDGRLLLRSAAVLHLGARLGGAWRVLAAVAGRVPPGPRDRAYDFVARVRHRLFARPADACPVIPERLRARFGP